jgi:hypothetical protein
LGDYFFTNKSGHTGFGTREKGCFSRPKDFAGSEKDFVGSTFIGLQRPLSPEWQDEFRVARRIIFKPKVPNVGTF